MKLLVFESLNELDIRECRVALPISSESLSDLVELTGVPM